MTAHNSAVAFPEPVTSSLKHPTSRTTRCTYRTPSGRRCRSECAPSDPDFCARHARPAVAFDPSDLSSTATLDLLGPIKDFQTAADVNHVLGRLVALLAADRIPVRTAGIIAYACQLLLLSLPDVNRVANERREVLGNDETCEQLSALLESLPNLQPPLDSVQAAVPGPGLVGQH